MDTSFEEIRNRIIFLVDKMLKLITSEEDNLAVMIGSAQTLLLTVAKSANLPKDYAKEILNQMIDQWDDADMIERKTLNKERTFRKVNEENTN